jgi:hypothetical protein
MNARTENAATPRTTLDRPAGVVVAITGDDDRFRATRVEAVRMAAEGGSRLILYDWDAATVLGEPLPSNWSAEGTDTETPSELDEAALEAAGRAPIAQQVRDARRAGVNASAWLPSEPGPDAMVRWARERGARTIVVPDDLDERGKLETLATGTTDPAKAVAEASPVRVVVVPKRENER